MGGDEEARASEVKMFVGKRLLKKSLENWKSLLDCSGYLIAQTQGT